MLTGERKRGFCARVRKWRTKDKAARISLLRPIPLPQLGQAVITLAARLRAQLKRIPTSLARPRVLKDTLGAAHVFKQMPNITIRCPFVYHFSPGPRCAVYLIMSPNAHIWCPFVHHCFIVPRCPMSPACGVCDDAARVTSASVEKEWKLPASDP
jgi:hypothetical protein